MTHPTTHPTPPATTRTADAPHPLDAATPSTPAAGRLWAYAGLAAGALGLVAVEASMRVDAVFIGKYAGNPEATREALADKVPTILTFHTALALATVLLLVFAAGLRRRLAVHAPVGSLLPDVAAAGLWLTAVAGLMGTGFTTEMVFTTTSDKGELLPAMAVVFGHWIGTIGWLWVGSGVTGVATAVAALRHGALPRWIGWVGVVFGGLALLTGVSPLQYMAGFFGPVFVLLAGAGFAFGDRTRPEAD